MKTLLVLVSVVLAGALSACDRAKEPEVRQEGPVSAVTNIQPPPQVPATSTPVEDAKTPIQGQVDPKEPPQRKDFETK